ncbi:hypothetical protein BJ878DRAFT_270384 [Calycina marina]|uniref:Uncharacterized protein n=1 Tax=Calycina marina TaxID=1763456 RepID=A0A9P8CH89_9HELO|nr:hypothetical protein BJ878DRAFT_270384 [Calycina marina]
MPRTRRKDRTASSGGPLPKDSQAYRPPLRPGDICVGCIVWLPIKENQGPSIKCRKDGCCGNGELKDGGYNHPVVVLKIKQNQRSSVCGDLVLTIAIMTSFKDMPLKHYLARKNIPCFRSSIPIRDQSSEGIEEAGIKQLDLERGRTMNKKQCYVKTDHVYKSPVSSLRSFGFGPRECRAYKMRLNPASYAMLMDELDLSPESFAVTETLFETAPSRLAVLAGNPVPTAQVPSSASQGAFVVPHQGAESYLNPLLGIPNAYVAPSMSTYAAVAINYPLVSNHRLPALVPSVSTLPTIRYPESTCTATQLQAYGTLPGSTHHAYPGSTYSGYRQDSQPSRQSRTTYQPPVYMPYTRPQPPEEESPSYWGIIVGFLGLAAFGWWRYRSS